jgi:outer membrane lipoprotein-sorting protein
MIGIAFLFVFESRSSAQNIPNEVIKRMDAYSSSLSALTADITMVKINKQLGGVAETDYGVLKYVPDKKSKKEKKPFVRIDFKKPERYFSIQDGRYYIYQPGTKQAYTGLTSSVKGQTGAGGPLAFLGMNRAELKQNYTFQYLDDARVQNSKKELTWHLRLTPVAAAKYQYAEVWVTKDGLPVQTMIVEKNGDSTTVLLTAHDDQAKIDLSTMGFKFPKDATVHREN